MAIEVNQKHKSLKLEPEILSLYQRLRKLLEDAERRAYKDMTRELTNMFNAWARTNNVHFSTARQFTHEVEDKAIAIAEDRPAKHWHYCQATTTLLNIMTSIGEVFVKNKHLLEEYSVSPDLKEDWPRPVMRNG